MTVPVRRSPTRRARPLSLGLSAVALAALTYLEVFPAHADDGATENSIHIADPMPAPASRRILLAEASHQAMPLPPPGLVVPSVEGMPLRQARKIMKNAGFKLVIRDSFNEQIDPELTGLYHVRRQSLEAGTRAEPGDWLRLHVRARNQPAMGY